MKDRQRVGLPARAPGSRGAKSTEIAGTQVQRLGFRCFSLLRGSLRKTSELADIIYTPGAICWQLKVDSHL